MVLVLKREQSYWRRASSGACFARHLRLRARMVTWEAQLGVHVLRGNGGGFLAAEGLLQLRSHKSIDVK